MLLRPPLLQIDFELAQPETVTLFLILHFCCLTCLLLFLLLFLLFQCRLFLTNHIRALALMFDLLLLALELCSLSNFLQYLVPAGVIAIHFGQHDVECPEHAAGADVVLEQSA